MAIDPVTPNTRSKLLADVPHDLTVRFDDGSAIEAHALILVLASPSLRAAVPALGKKSLNLGAVRLVALRA